MNIAFIPFSARCPQHKSSASIRFRALWPAKHIPNAVVTTSFQRASRADIIFFQKVYGGEFDDWYWKLKKQGKIIVLDMCDPDWVMPSLSYSIQKAMNASDLIITPTEMLAEEVRKRTKTKVAVVDDGMDMDYHKKVKVDYKIKKQPIVCWFGNRGTVDALHNFMPELETVYGMRSFTLRVIADDGVHFQSNIPIDFVPWTLDTFIDELIESDVAFNPKLPNWRDSLKSRNKTYTAWASGVPCVETKNNLCWDMELYKLLTLEEERFKKGRVGRNTVYVEHSSRVMAEEYMKLFKKLYAKNRNQNSNVASKRKQPIRKK